MNYDLEKIKIVIDMLDKIDDIEMEEIIEDFISKGTQTHLGLANRMQDILNNFNELVEFYWFFKEFNENK